LFNDNEFDIFSTLVSGSWTTPVPFFPCGFNGGRLERLLRGKTVATEKLTKRKTPIKSFGKSMFVVTLNEEKWTLDLTISARARLSRIYNCWADEALSKSASHPAPHASGV
jgi:hypothetical protein